MRDDVSSVVTDRENDWWGCQYRADAGRNEVRAEHYRRYLEKIS